MDALNADEIALALKSLPDWTYDDVRRALFRQMLFPDFSAAFGAMVRIASAAETQDHHPEWFNVYNRLDIWLTTHDAGGVSPRDVRMAGTIDALIL